MTAKENAMTHGKENAMTEQALMPVDPAPAQATRAVAVVTPMDMLQVAFASYEEAARARAAAERRYGFSENHGGRA